MVDAYEQPGLLHSGFHAIVPVTMSKSFGSQVRVILLAQDKRALGLSLSHEQHGVIRASLEKMVSAKNPEMGKSFPAVFSNH